MLDRVSPKKSVWIRGEDAAARHMKRSGYRVLDRNVRMPMGEIDLVCLEPKSNTLVLVEVKARLSKLNDSRQIDPEANITSAKKAKLRTLAQAVIKSKRFPGRAIRIDVIAVVFVEGQSKPAELRHYESAV
ncbi:MAG: YraN family protein [Phycisphaerales bacterium]